MVQASLFTLAPVALGIVTIFGRKGKKEGKEEDKLEKAPSPQQPATQPSPTNISLANVPGTSSLDLEAQHNSEPPANPEETSLNKLLQSLLQEVPFTSTPHDDTAESTSDWVPPMTAPPSRPMIIVERDKGEKIRAPAQPEESVFFTKPAPPIQRPETDQGLVVQPQSTRPTPPPAQKITRPEQEANKPSRLDKPEKQETKQSAPAPSSKGQQGFDHLFELTKGGLDTPGLIVVSGQLGSGKTSLASNLAGAYLATGADCILVCYDQPVGSMRENIKNTGWDASKYESEFHLLIFDAFSGQTDSMSSEPYSIEKPFDLDSATETLARNMQMMMSNKVRVIVDSITGLASRNSPKEFLAKFRGLLDKTRALGSTVIVTVDNTSLPKETVGSLEEMATCVIELRKDGQAGGQLNVKKLNSALSKSDPQDFEIQQGKGLLFT